MAAAQEAELKFLFAEKDFAKIKQLVAASRDAGQKSYCRLRAVYFDTPRQDLWKHGFSLRIRLGDGLCRQTVKQLSSSSVQRGEWEEEIGGREPDLAQLKNTPLAGLVAKASIFGALGPAFEVDVERTSFSLETPAGTIEASFDKGSIAAQGETLGVRELELELKSGEPSALFNLAHAFVSQAPLRLSLISKAERGHLLARGAWGRAAKSSTPRLDKDSSCRQAFREICRTCLHDFHLNVPVFEAADSAEGIHQGRVAIRRLRAALTFFKPLVFDTAYPRTRGELKWLAGLLGAARDLDVLQAGLQPLVCGTEAGARARKLVKDCEAKRLRAHQAIVEALDSERGRAMLLDVAAWIEDGPWQSQPSSLAEKPIQGFARTRLKGRWKALVKRGKDFAKLGSAARHQIRIEAKKMRYMAEFFVPVQGIARDRKHLQALIETCERLQSSLGAVRDREAMAEFLRKAALSGGSRQSLLGGTAKLYAASRPDLKGSIAKDFRRASRAYAKLASIEPF